MRWFEASIRSWFRWFVVGLVCLLSVGCSELEQADLEQRVVANIYEGERQLTLGNMVQARGWFDRAVAIDPNAPETYIGFGDQSQGGLIQVLSDHDDWPDAVQYLSQAVTRPQIAGQWQIWLGLAQAYDSLGQSANSKAAYLRELAILNGSTTLAKGSIFTSVDPSELPLQKANAEWGAGQLEQARADYLHIISHYPQDAANAQNALAYSEADANVRIPEALSLATAAVASARNADEEDDTVLGEYLDTLGWAEYRAGSYSNAARDMEEALSYIPRESISHYHLAQIYASLGQKQAASIEIARAVGLDPANPLIQSTARTLQQSPTATGA
jgi:Tfp pilus assembly protein PilF